MGIAVEIGLSAPEEEWSLQGFGKDVTGAGPSPATTYTVTSSAEQGAGTWESIVNTSPPVHDCLIQFAVSTVNVYFTRELGSNVTIDGTVNGQNGVTFNQPTDSHRAVGFSDPCENILIRGIRFQGTEGSVSTVEDLVYIDGTNGDSISGVAFDRCTFVGAGDGALDITGNVTDVTVQRCLFYGTGPEADGGTSLIKYNTRERITIWGTVYGEGGYDRNPQIKGDCNPFEFVSNIVYRDADGHWGFDIRGGAPASDSPGLPTGNIRGCYFYGTQAILYSNSDSGYTPDVYQAGNTFGGSCANPGSPRGSQVTITEGYQITPLSYSELEAEVLDKVGAPNKTSRDNEVIENVRALL